MDNEQRRKKAVNRVIDCGVIAVIRLQSAQGLVEVARSLTIGGVIAIEVTMTTPGALEAISQACETLSEEALIGAGTVLTPKQAADAIEAGATFLVAPTLDSDVLNLAHDAGLPYVPGALTPNEIHHAMTLGADLIKLFPGQVATPGYIKDVLGPFPTARLLPTGNVNLSTLPEYIKAGAVAVGVGKTLIDPKAVLSSDWKAITECARQFSLAVERSRRELL